MREAVMVSTARTPITKAHRGEFNVTPGATLAAFAVKAAVERAGINPGLIEDAILGCGYPEGTAGARLAGHAPIEGRRRGIRYAVVTMCVGGGMGAAGLFEIY